MVKNTPTELSSTSSLQSVNPCRYFKVPADQKSVNPEVYKPYLFSFGPYHAAACNTFPAAGSFRDSAAPADVTVDGRSLSERSHSFAAVSSHPSSGAITAVHDGDHFKHLAAEELGLQDRSQLIDMIKQHDQEFRKMYVQMSQAHQDLIDASCLADLLALDGIAIVAATMPDNVTELIYSIRRLILSDAILLENQIPVLVVNYALESICKAGRVSDVQLNLENVLKWYLKRMNPFPRVQPPEYVIIDVRKPLLHHFYEYITEANIHDTATSADSVPALPSASHLARCGVRFRPCHDSSFKGIHFDEKNTVLYIPKIQVTDTTVRFLHNLLAYEATAHYPRKFSVISYVHFMDGLIDTEDDSRVLVEAGVIGNTLGSHADLATMWNKLGISVLCRITLEDCRCMEQLEALTKRRLRRWRAAFEEKYWERQPWLLISLLAATILLVLTLLQTIYTMKSSFAPPAP